jgi:hypothetical protein
MQIFGISPEEQAVRLENIGMFDFVYAQNAADNLLKSGVISNPIDVEDYYTNEFLDTSWDRAAIEADAAAYVCSSPAYKAANS